MATASAPTVTPPASLPPLTITIGVSSSALFDTRKADQIFCEEGENAYKSHMNRYVDKPWKPGAAFHFIDKMLRLNGKANMTVNVPVLSHMNPFASRRVNASISENGLDAMLNGERDTSGSIYTGGKPITPEILSAMNVDLFLSTDERDVQAALTAGKTAALLSRSPLPEKALKTKSPRKIVMGFDFCRVLGISYGVANDPFKGDSEDYFAACYAQNHDFVKSLAMYREREIGLANSPSDPGPLAAFYIKICAARDRLLALKLPTESELLIDNRIITTRDMGALARVAPTTHKWGAEPDEMVSCGKTSKGNYVADVDLFLDDSRRNIAAVEKLALAAQVPWNNDTPRGLFAPPFNEALAAYKKQKKALSKKASIEPVVPPVAANDEQSAPLTLKDFYFTDVVEVPIDYAVAQMWVQAARALGNRYSQDPSTKVGVLVITPENELVAVGVNNFPAGVEMTPQRLNDRTYKYPLVSHGEESAVHAIATVPGASTQGNLLVLTGYPCHDCATAIANTGLKALVGLEAPEPSSLMLRWSESMKTFAEITLRESETPVFPIVVATNDTGDQIDIVGELESLGIELRTGHVFNPPIPMAKMLRRQDALAKPVAA